MMIDILYAVPIASYDKAEAEQDDGAIIEPEQGQGQYKKGTDAESD